MRSIVNNSTNILIEIYTAERSGFQRNSINMDSPVNMLDKLKPCSVFCIWIRKRPKLWFGGLVLSSLKLHWIYINQLYYM